MNVTDIKDLDLPEGDMLENIFARQKELMDKYHHIENNQGVGHGILQGKEFNINEIRSQCLVKDFAWRITEELAEAHEPGATQEHFLEELSDALHFYTELLLLVDIGIDEVVPGCKGDHLKTICNLFYAEPKHLRGENIFSEVILHIGLAMNCLKQKPWKQTHILTDVSKFKKHLIHGYWGLILYIFAQDHIRAEDIYLIYFKKSEVNKFRQRSNY